MIDQAIISTLQISSVNLVRLDDNLLPTLGGGSGCLLSYKGQRFLLSVAHVTERHKPVSLQMYWDPMRRQTATRSLGKFSTVCFADLIDGTKDIVNVRDIDFSYLKLPFDDLPKFQELDQMGSGTVLASRDCILWTDEAITQPTSDHLYGFAGLTRRVPFRPPGIAPDVTMLDSRMSICYPFEFVGTLGDLYAFACPIPHPGDEFFRGCSGAPIIDMSGHAVALVCSGYGNEQGTLIYGFPLNRANALLTVETMGLV